MNFSNRLLPTRLLSTPTNRRSHLRRHGPAPTFRSCPQTQRSRDPTNHGHLLRRLHPRQHHLLPIPRKPNTPGPQSSRIHHRAAVLVCVPFAAETLGSRQQIERVRHGIQIRDFMGRTPLFFCHGSDLVDWSLRDLHRRGHDH